VGRKIKTVIKTINRRDTSSDSVVPEIVADFDATRSRAEALLAEAVDMTVKRMGED